MVGVPGWPVRRLGARKKLHDYFALARTSDLEGGHVIGAFGEERRVQRQTEFHILLATWTKRKFRRDNFKRRTETPAEGAGGEV